MDVTINLAGKPYTVSVETAEEPSLRSIVHHLNEQYQGFRAEYPRADSQDILAMLLLTTAKDLHHAQLSVADQDLSPELERLNAFLDSTLEHFG